MESEYGDKEGKSVFYASLNKGKITGVERRKGDRRKKDRRSR